MTEWPTCPCGSGLTLLKFGCRSCRVEPPEATVTMSEDAESHDMWAERQKECARAWEGAEPVDEMPYCRRRDGRDRRTSRTGDGMGPGEALGWVLEVDRLREALAEIATTVVEYELGEDLGESGMRLTGIIRDITREALEPRP